MTAKEAIEKLNNDNEVLYTQKSNGEHLATLIGLGRVVPAYKACAKNVVKNGQLDVLEGDYQLTKSGRFARLNNTGAFFKVLTYKFGL